MNGSAIDGTPRWAPEPDPAEAVGRVRMAFLEQFGRAPDGVWAAPGRVNLIGEHVDYAQGLCLPLALAHRTYVALSRRDGGRVSVRSLQQPDQPWDGALDEVAAGNPSGWAAYAAGVAWALAQEGHDVPGFDACVDGQVPLGGGLSSSAALECAVALALDDVAELGLGGDDAGRAALAAACQRAENEVAGAATGGMDQAAALRCRQGHALLLDSADARVAHVPLDLPGAGLALLVIDTRAVHELTDGQYGDRRKACERAACALGVESLREVDIADLDGALARLEPVLRPVARHVVTEIDRVRTTAELLRAGKVRDVGTLLDASHASLREDYRVSCAELDTAVQAARDAGALGARMTGGGFGGSAIALLPADAVAQVARAVTAAFDRRGYEAPVFLEAVPSAAAERVG